ncbi:hypothetical protein DPC56_00430 [Methanothermobacter tenebrarum]|uniref:Uncharacterized protein n=1 Tax=Methanothermobacter tenebrarum TaxID=680118 RepID=A0A328PIT3_9EURY|nr:hypothetical protein DPC56_00430 [Methanothermobacter tenebrarum]
MWISPPHKPPTWGVLSTNIRILQTVRFGPSLMDIAMVRLETFIFPFIMGVFCSGPTPMIIFYHGMKEIIISPLSTCIPTQYNKLENTAKTCGGR